MQYKFFYKIIFIVIDGIIIFVVPLLYMAVSVQMLGIYCGALIEIGFLLTLHDLYYHDDIIEHTNTRTVTVSASMSKC